MHSLLIPTEQASGLPLPVSQACGLIPTPVTGTHFLAQGHIQVQSSMRQRQLLNTFRASLPILQRTMLRLRMTFPGWHVRAGSEPVRTPGRAPTTCTEMTLTLLPRGQQAEGQARVGPQQSETELFTGVCVQWGRRLPQGGLSGERDPSDWAQACPMPSCGPAALAHTSS